MKLPAPPVSQATLNGNVSAGWPLPTVSFFWGLTDGGPSTGAWDHQTVVGIAGGGFASAVTGLVSDTAYFYRSYATNAVGSAWSPASDEFDTLLFEFSIGSMPVTSAIPTVNWQGEIGWTYSLESSSNLMDTNAWQYVPGCSNIPGTGASMSLTDTNAAYAYRYYRLVAD